MKTFLFIASLLLSLTEGKAAHQETELKGYLGVEGGTAYTFRLVFTDSSGYIKGYSYTWLHENNEVKAAITGYIDRSAHTLSFRETSIVYNHGFESQVTICLINALLSYKQDAGQRVFSGPITSKDLSNVYCGNGTISFADSETLRNLFNTAAPPPVEKPKQEAPSGPKRSMQIVYDTAVSQKPIVSTPPVSTSEPEKITAGKDKVIEWESDSVVVEIWDGGKEDGDVISILHNDRPVLENYVLKKQVKRLRLPVIGMETNTISFIAGREGNEPPNTADVLLFDGGKRYPILVYNTIGKTAVIRIRKRVK